jgi:O-antigen/teichoic acid export membrane protein
MAPIFPDRERPLAHGVFLMFGTRALVQVCGLSGTIILARTLGPSGRGAVAVALGFGLLLAQFGSLGLPYANLYFAARNPSDIGVIVLNTVWTIALGGAILIGATFAAKALFPAILRGLDWVDVGVLAVGVPALVATFPLQNVFLAERRIQAYNAVELAGSVAVFIGLAIGLAILHVGVLGALVVIVAANWGTVLVFLALQRSHIPRFSRPDLRIFRRMFKYGFRIYLTTAIAYLVGRINLIFVNAHLGPAQAGFYAIGLSIGDTLHLLPSIVPLNLFPRIARGETFESSATVFRVLFILFGGLCLFTIPLIRPVIELLYGSRFAAAVAIYYWLLPGIFCYGMISTLSYHFAGRGFPLEALLVWIPGLAVNLAVVVFFLPGHKAYIAALASGISYAIVLVLHMRLFAKESGGYRALLPRPRETVSLVGTLAHDTLVGFRSRLRA